MSCVIRTFLFDLGFPENTCPDGIDPDFLSIDERHVISRDKKGDVISRFQDVRWNFSYYASREVKINFKRIYEADVTNGKVIYHDLKLCCFYLLYFPAFKAIRAVVCASEELFFFADNAIEKKISFRQSLNDISTLKGIEASNALSSSEKYSKLAKILSAYNRLGRLSALFPTFDFSPDKDAYSFALKYSRLFKKDRKINQTPVIPTRLLSEVITECSRTLCSVFSETGLMSDKHNMLLHEVISELLDKTIRICDNATGKENENAVSCIDSIPSAVIHSRYETLHILNGQSRYWNALKPFGISNFNELRVFFSYFFSCGRTLVQIFTGMRFEESSNVPYNGFETIVLEGERVFFIRSWTTKLESESARFARWFTSELFVDFNRSIQVLVGLFYSKYKGINIDTVDQSMYPLFPAISGRTQVNPYFNYPSFRKFNTNSGWRPHKSLTLDPERFSITETDMAELRQQVSWRDWQGEGFCVGKLFPFTSHQFRRSLVVYAARSGLVSLPSLQSNLQHLTQTMTAYYATGASYADNFILSGDSDSGAMKSIKSFVNDFRNEEREVEIDYIWNDLVNSNDVLFGSFGSFLQRRKSSGDLPVIFESRESIDKAVRKGKLAYTKTPLGGCCAVVPCEKSTFTSITACVLCENAVFNTLSALKLEKTLHNMKVKLSKFDSSSPFALQLKKEVNAIESVLANHIKSLEEKNRDN